MDSINLTLSSTLEHAMVTISKQAAEIDDLQRLASLSEGIIYGVPLVSTENLTDVFNKICRIISFECDKYNVIAVNRQRKPRSLESCPIFIKFLSPAVRSKFFECYLKKRNLSLRDLGFDVDKRIYFNECVSKATQRLYLTAMTYKRNGALQRVHTYNGHVYVRASEGAESIKITTEANLISVVENLQSSKRRLSDSNPTDKLSTTQASKSQKVGPASVKTNKTNFSPLMPGSSTWMSTRSKTNASSSMASFNHEITRPLGTLVNPFKTNNGSTQRN